MTTKKVMLLGEIGVGKSSLARRLVFDTFENDYKPTLGVDIYQYEVPQGKNHKATSLVLWDTDGNLGQSIFQHIYMKQASAAVILGDATRRATIDTMCELGNEFAKAFPGRCYSYVINKIDLVSQNEQLELPDDLKKSSVSITKSSAKTGHNVAEVFSDIASAIQRRGL